MGHEVGDALEHAPGLEDERRERHLVQIHSHPGASHQPREDDRQAWARLRGRQRRGERTYLSWEMSDEMMEPSFSSLYSDVPSSASSQGGEEAK